jgi:serine protease Do
VDEELIANANLRVDRGAVVQRVFDASPAAQAGIRAGDILLRLGRVDITPEMPFINALAQHGTRDRISVQVLRDGRVQELPLELTPR